MGAGIPSLLWPVTQFCIINRPVSGEHLGESIELIKVIINSSSYFSIGYKPGAFTTLHTSHILYTSHTSIMATLESRR